MSPELVVASHGVMEGKGAYNRYAKLPAGGAALALPLWEKAVQCVEFDTGDHPVVVADYGSSQGKNSMVPIQVAIRGLRHRLGPNRAISVFHVDQPSNDFNALFQVLDLDPDRYAVDDPNVFPGVIGRSFYENVLPPGSVHLGWSSYAAVWLSSIPALIPGHFISLRGPDPVRAEFDRQAARDWEAFLSLRARELRPGSRLVVVLPGLADDGSSGFENIMDQGEGCTGGDGSWRRDCERGTRANGARESSPAEARPAGSLCARRAFSAPDRGRHRDIQPPGLCMDRL